MQLPNFFTWPSTPIAGVCEVYIMDINLTPGLNLEFDNIEDAWEFWRNYDGRTGFGIRKERFNKRRKDGSYSSYLFVCCKEGCED